MEEDEEDAERTDKTRHEEVDTEELAAEGSPIGKLVLEDFARHIPPQENTGKECTQRHEELRRKMVATIEECQTEE